MYNIFNGPSKRVLKKFFSGNVQRPKTNYFLIINICFLWTEGRGSMYLINVCDFIGQSYRTVE